VNAQGMARVIAVQQCFVEIEQDGRYRRHPVRLADRKRRDEPGSGLMRRCCATLGRVCNTDRRHSRLGPPPAADTSRSRFQAL
jgi:hypothetical protein